MRLFLAGLATALFFASTTAKGQSPSLIIVGHVATASGSPIAGADVSAGDAESVASKFVRTDASGSFRILFPRGPATIAITARFIGYAAKTERISVSATDSAVVVREFRLAPSTQSLPAVRTVARRQPPSRSVTFNAPGENPITSDPSSFLSNDLTGDLSGDISLALATIPGVTITPNPQGGPPNISLAGLGSDQNRVTMNGSDFGGSPPRDGGVLRISTQTYDVAKSTSGAQTDWIMMSGGGIPVRKLHLTLDSPALQWTTPIGDRLGQRTSYPIVSGQLSGWPGTIVELASVTFQASRRMNDLTTLSSADAETLGALRLNADSVARLLSSLGALGIPSASLNQAAASVTTSASMYTRLDFTRSSMAFSLPQASGRTNYDAGLGDGHEFYLIAGGDWSESKGLSAGPSTLSLFASESRRTSATIQAVNSSVLHDFILNETRTSLTVGSNRSAPGIALPSASILMSSPSADGEPSLSSVQAAGNGDARNETRSWSWQTTNETRWSTESKKHEMKVVLETTLDHFSIARDPSLGAFSFNSLSDFIASRPALFVRTITPTTNSINGLHTAIGIGDVYTPSKVFAMQYGARIEGHQFDGGGSGNPLVDSLFGVRSARLPSVIAVSPMAGFTWRYGHKDAQGYADGYRSVVGGIKDYRGLLRTPSIEPYTRETGLPSGTQQVFCVGDAVPPPTWGTFLQSSASIPQRCADGTPGSSFAQTTPRVSLVAPGYTVGHSWRTDLTWNTRLSDRLFGSVHGLSAFNSSQEESFDLNFGGMPRFTLASEGGRPVYVSPASIVPGTGATSTTESRRFPTFAQVNERRSDGGSQFHSITGSLDYRPEMSFNSSGIKLPLIVAYTLTDARAQSNGFYGSTAGDPRLMSAGPGTFSRHALQLSTFVRNPDWGTLSVALRVRSGMAYTPSVNGDINGDGFSNDRAFVFDPRTAPDSALANGVSRLLATAPGSASDCLHAQLGSIAGQNSCTGPWAATMNASVTLNTARFRLQNRGSVRLQIINVLAGLDQLLHGANSLRGWGQSAYPDPTLLTVRGFDPAQKRFLYAVNPQFGNTSTYRNLFSSPFKIMIDVNLDIGPDQERARMLAYVRPKPTGGIAAYDSASLAVKLVGNRDDFFGSVIRMADDLKLEPWVVDSLQKMQKRHASLRDSVYGALAGYLHERRGDYDHEEVQAHWRTAIDSVAWDQWRIVSVLHAMLSEKQMQALALGSPFDWRLFTVEDKREVERRLERWLPGVPF